MFGLSAIIILLPPPYMNIAGLSRRVKALRKKPQTVIANNNIDLLTNHVKLTLKKCFLIRLKRSRNSVDIEYLAFSRAFSKLS